MKMKPEHFKTMPDISGSAKDSAARLNKPEAQPQISRVI
jgi:hypothetical protein